MSNVLIVEDDRAVREALGQTLELADFDVITAASFVEAKDHITADFAGVIVSDIRMPGRDGLYLLNYAQGQDAELPVILLTGEGDIPTAVGAMSKGAFDFLEKPCPPDQIAATVARALEARNMVLDRRRVHSEMAKGDAATRIIFGISPQAEALRAQVRKIAPIESPVLIAGAPGTGTGKIATVIHQLSNRAGARFAKSAASGLTPQALDQILANNDGGTVLLDEIGTLPPDTQFALLEHLEPGGPVRILASTTRDLDGAALHGDLVPMLDALRVTIPALKERPEDIPHMFRLYAAQACEQAGVPERPVSAEMAAQLMAQDWPGNARALMNAAMRFALGLDPEDNTDDLGLAERMAQIEAQLLQDALRKAGGRATQAAEALKLPRKTLYDKLAKYRLKAEDYR